MKTTLATILTAALLATPAMAVVTIEIDPGPIGSSLDRWEFEYDDLNGTTLDGSVLEIEFVLPAGRAIRLDYDRPVTVAGLDLEWRLFVDGDDFPSVGNDSGNALGFRGANVSSDFIVTGADLFPGRGLTSGGEYFADWDANPDTDALPDGYTFDGLTFTGLLSNEGFAVTRSVLELSVFNESNGGRANLVVIPEPTSLALLGLGGLLIARRRR
ncbi:MAG: PEP-CTERM sorting domain-containing protein [Planctomycetota bacterium]